MPGASPAKDSLPTESLDLGGENLLDTARLLAVVECDGQSAWVLDNKRDARTNPAIPQRMEVIVKVFGNSTI